MKQVYLVGNPNTGKTTLYNSLTGAHEHVGNWHGVTVEEKARRYQYKGQEIEIVDLPGIYSLTALSYEEQVAVDFILKDPSRIIINICDASNLQRNLYLTLGLLELGAKVILVVNEIDRVPLNKIDYAGLSQELAIPVVAINAGKKVNLNQLNEVICNYPDKPLKTLPYLKQLSIPDICALLPKRGAKIKDAKINETNKSAKELDSRLSLDKSDTMEDNRKATLLQEKGANHLFQAKQTTVDKKESATKTVKGHKRFTAFCQFWKRKKSKQKTKESLSADTNKTDLAKEQEDVVCERKGSDVFYAMKLLEDDAAVLKRLGLQKNPVTPAIEKVSQVRYDYIEKVMHQHAKTQSKVYGRSKLDKIFMNRFLAFPIFIGLLALVFYLTFFSIGAWCSDGLVWLLDKCVGSPLIALCTNIFGPTSWVVGLVQVAVVGGVGSILGFLPQVALLFLFLSLLEDSGYLARVAFVFEDILGKVGLSGKSVYTLLMGFGCSTTAVLTARNMEDKNSKIKTGLLTPYMSCSAKFPIYAVLGGAFFGANNIFVILGLYLLGVVVAIALSYMFEKTILKSKEQTFILEFPPYHAMNAKRIISVLWENVRLFLARVGTLLISMNIIVWLLGNFSFTLRYIPNAGGQSMLEVLGRVLAPIFAPLGFGSWGLVAALIAGLIAKEVIVSSVAMFNHVDGASDSMIGESVKDPTAAIFFAGPAAALSYLVFCLLYFPCLATFSVLCKEIGRKWAFIGAGIQFAVAYIVTLIVYQLARLSEVFGVWQVLGSVVIGLVILMAFWTIVRKIRKKRTCNYCTSCTGSCHPTKK